MIYNVKDKLPISKLLLFSVQLLCSVWTATVLIANVCGVSISGALVGAGASTIIYCICTAFNSPMIISNSGALVAPVLIAMATGGYTAIAIGGVTSAIVYLIFGFIFTKISIENIYKIFPKVLIGSITVVIGINLMSFIPNYIGESGNLGIVISLVTVFAIALSSHYLKGIWSMFPFLIGTLVGYLISIPFGLVNFDAFENVSFF